VLVPSRIYERYLNSRGVHHTGLWTRGVDPEEFHPRYRSDAYRARLGVGPDDLLVTYIGRLAKEKDLERLIAAWQNLEGRRGNAQLVLAGRGPLEEELRTRAIPGVHLAGLLAGRELAEAYAGADLFVFPSSTETFGNSLLEAMASGLPALSVRAGGVLEFAEHDTNAWLVPPRDTRALTDGLARLMADPALRARLAEGAIRTAAGRRWDRIYDRLIEDYQWTARQHRAIRAA
jgi:glycosyltransferase involved in cell wall biosynthesis